MFHVCVHCGDCDVRRRRGRLRACRRTPAFAWRLGGRTRMARSGLRQSNTDGRGDGGVLQARRRAPEAHRSHAAQSDGLDVHTALASEWIQRREEFDRHTDPIIREAFQIACWDSSLITVKLHRAMDGHDRFERHEEEADNGESTTTGTARPRSPSSPSSDRWMPGRRSEARSAMPPQRRSPMRSAICIARSSTSFPTP